MQGSSYLVQISFGGEISPLILNDLLFLNDHFGLFRMSVDQTLGQFICNESERE